MQDILLSFIVPMYNSVEYIKQCLDSIECQGIPKGNYEIVIVDDGSRDGCDAIASSYDSVVYYRQVNQGQSVARNKGIEIAKGKYVCFVDSDDALVKNSIGYLLNIALDNDLDVITYNIITCSSSQIDSITPRQTNVRGPVMNGYEYIEKYNFNNGPWWYLVRKELLNGIRFECGRYAEDGMFTMTMLMNVKRIIHVDNACYYYIIRPSSTTTKRGVTHVSKMVDDYYYAYTYMQKLIINNHEYLSQAGLNRCVSRSLSYIFFAAVRLLYLPKNISNKWYKKFHDEGLLPIEQPYPGLKFKLTSFVLNNYMLFSIIRLLIYNYYRVNSLLSKK